MKTFLEILKWVTVLPKLLEVIINTVKVIAEKIKETKEK